LIQVLSIMNERFLSLGTQDVGRLPRFVEESLTFGFCFLRCFREKCGALLVKLLVFLLKLFVFLLGFLLFRIRIREFFGDQFLPRVNGVEDGFVKKALQQPHEDEEVQRLRRDSKPV